MEAKRNKKTTSFFI